MPSTSHQVNSKTDALIVIDVQRDFCEGGALPVPRGDEVVPVLNRWLRIDGLLKIATRDWHPRDHCSFTAHGGSWLPHCVQNTPGAEFHPALHVAEVGAVFSKGADPARDAYSDFNAAEFSLLLKRRNIRRLWIGGLATEYCIKATVLDGCKAGYHLFVIVDAIRGIEAKPGDCEQAMRTMTEAGAVFVSSDDVLNSDVR